MPHKSSVSMGWRLRGSRYGLVGSKCLGCHRVYFPPVDVCKDCGGSGFEKAPVSDTGVIESFSVIRAAPVGFDAPYNIGLVRLGGGQLISTQLVGNVSVGARVVAVFRRLREDGSDGVVHYSFKFAAVG